MFLKKNTAITAFPFTLLSAADFQPATTWPCRGNLTLTFGGDTTSALSYSAAASDVQAALMALGSIGAGNLACTGGPLPASYIDAEFQGSLANAPQALLTAANNLAGGLATDISISHHVNGAAPVSVNRQDTITGDPSPPSTFQIMVSNGGGTQTAMNIPGHAAAADVQSALEALANVGSGNVSVSGAGYLDDPASLVIEWIGALAADAMGYSSAVVLYGNPYSITQTQVGSYTPGANEVQRIAVTHGSVGCYRMLDGGAPALLAASPTDHGNGQWSVNLTAAETNANLVGLLFTAPGCVPATFTILTQTKVVADLQDLSAAQAAAAILVTPAQKLYTDASGYVRSKSDTGAALALGSQIDLNAIADAVLARDVSHVEAAAGGHSLCYLVLAGSEADRVTNAGYLTVYRTDGVTEFCRKTLTTASSAPAAVVKVV